MMAALSWEQIGPVFAGRSVFVTGHTGFKGSWLSIWLHCLGARVTGYALAPPTSPSNFEASAVGELLAAHHEADLRDSAGLQAALQGAAATSFFTLRPSLSFARAMPAPVRRSTSTSWGP